MVTENLALWLDQSWDCAQSWQRTLALPSWDLTASHPASYQQSLLAPDSLTQDTRGCLEQEQDLCLQYIDFALSFFVFVFVVLRSFWGFVIKTVLWLWPSQQKKIISSCLCEFVMHI